MGKEELNKAKPENVVISLERTMCFGPCPAYKITILGNGSVIYDGKVYVKTIGKRYGKISLKKVKELIDEFYKIDFFSLEDQILQARDIGSVIITVTINGITKKVESQYWPEELYELTKKIDKLTNSAKWVGRNELKNLP